MLLPAGGALAHVRADIAIVSPAENASVPAAFDVVVSATGGGTASADFELLLDGRPVDRAGNASSGAAFTGQSLRAGQRLTIRLQQPSRGAHQLTLRYAGDVDNARPDVVRNFVVTGAGERAQKSGPPRALVIVPVFLLLAASIALRRRGLRQR